MRKFLVKLFLSVFIGFLLTVLYRSLNHSQSIVTAELLPPSILMQDGSSYIISREEVIVTLQSETFLKKVESRTKISGLVKKLTPSLRGGSANLEIKLARTSNFLTLILNGCSSYKECDYVLEAIVYELNENILDFKTANFNDLDKSINYFEDAIRNSGEKDSLANSLIKLKSIKLMNNDRSSFRFLSGISKIEPSSFDRVFSFFCIVLLVLGVAFSKNIFRKLKLI